MSNDDDYISLNLSKDMDDSGKSDYVSLNPSKDMDGNGKSVCGGAKEQLDSAYHAFVDTRDAMEPNLGLLSPFSKKEASDFREALRGDYNEHYHQIEDGIFLLPEHQVFEERLEHSTFDNMNIDSESFKFRFLVPFIIKAELKPGLAFGEALLTLVHVLTLFSVLINGMTFIAVIIGGGSLFLLLTILHFWYGMSRYPSLWNRFTPHGLKGNSVDRNFSEIRNICSHHCNGHDRTYSQLKQFVITLPFTIIYHTNAFLVTMVYFLFQISHNGRNIPAPVTTSLFLSNLLISSFWWYGGTSGIIFSTCTVLVNQRVYDSLLFNRDLKDFFISLVFGNLVLIEKKITVDEEGVALSENAPEEDVESGTQIKREADCSYNQTAEKSEIATKSASALLPLSKHCSPPPWGTNACSTNCLTDKGPTQQTQLSTNPSADPSQHTFLSAIQNIISFASEEELDETNERNRLGFKPEIFIDESLSQQSDDMELKHLVTVVSTPTEKKESEKKIAVNTVINPETPKETGHVPEVKTNEMELSTKSGKKNFFSRIFSSPRKKRSQIFFPEDKGDDEQLSVEFLNPSDVYLDIENHPGTVEWRNAITESVQRFRIKSYTLRKHMWVTNQMRGRSFFIKEDGKRRRKLKRKEIKEHCKAFHAKQLHLNSKLSGILDDLKDLKKNHSNSKSSSDHTRNSFAYNNSKSNSDHTRSSLVSNPLELNEQTDYVPYLLSTVEEECRKPQDKYEMKPQDKYEMIDPNEYTDKSADKSTDFSFGKDSLVDSSKESTISTLTESFAPYEYARPDEEKKNPWIVDSTSAIKDKEHRDDSLSFTERIQSLLACGPWADNINLLRESGSGSIQQHEVEGEPDIVNLENDSPPQNGGLKSCMKETGCTDGKKPLGMFDDLGGEGEASNEPYWLTFVEEKPILNSNKNPKSNSSLSSGQNGDPIPAVPLKTGKRRKFHPWKSDLQKKRLEKARNSRSQDQELSIMKPKRVITMFKMKKKKVVVEEHVIHPPPTTREKNDLDDDRGHVVFDDYGCKELEEDLIRDCECGGVPNFSDDVSTGSFDLAFSSPAKEVKGTYAQIIVNESAAGVEEQDVLEQREEENIVSDIRLMNADRFVS